MSTEMMKNGKLIAHKGGYCSVKFHQLFIASLHEPKKLAAFRLLPIGRVIKYVFFFVTILTAISFGRFLFGDTELFVASPELSEYSKTMGGLIYPTALVFQFVIATFYVFVRISLFAAIGLIIGKIMRKRVEYRFLWRTAAMSITVPLVATIIFDFFPSMETSSTLVTSIIHIAIITLALKYYPKAAR